MGNIFESLFNRLYGPKKLNLLIVGLNGTGKTTILYRLKLNDMLTTIPTIGFNVETVDYRNISFTVWDVGGGDRIRPLLRHYYSTTNGIIFVVDSNDRDCIDEARDMLHEVVGDDQLENKSVLVLANKQDMPEALRAAQLTGRLDLPKLTTKHDWYIQSTCARTGEGIYEGLDWLSESLMKIKTMGNIFASLFNRLYGPKQMRLLMVGLDAAGKTTMLYKLKLNDLVTTIPTIGFNVETVEYRNISFTVWDIGGQSRIRPLWRCYYNNAQGIIFVVDSNDRDRMDEAREVLQEMLGYDELRNVSVLVLANKQDLPNALRAPQITERMELHKLRTHDWYIQSTCATTGEGIYEGLDWLSQSLMKKV
ncbi:uncharacterized protein LOC128951486 [Oppia nitens]|uniref:uncharacterized protein LOC128951486 n=1 Tax=Oppia nitens TaxID=1686743 RepID=UPI0023DBF4D0|nr:uncharacterized protein LOC128951486 [Oppia nitens]